MFHGGAVNMGKRAVRHGTSIFYHYLSGLQAVKLLIRLLDVEYISHGKTAETLAGI